MLRSIIHPTKFDRLPLEEAAQILDEEGIMPAEAVQMIIDDEQGNTFWPYFGPSSCFPDKVCRREMLLKRFTDYDLDPLKRWNAMEGVRAHALMEAVELHGWRKEVFLPEEEDRKHPKVRVVERNGREVLQIELYPGFWTRMKIDRVSKDWTRVIDFKFPKYPWHPTPPWRGGKPGGKPLEWENRDAREEWAIQLGLYSRAIWMLKGVRPEELWVWRLYRGSQHDGSTHRKIPIRVLDDDQLWGMIKEHTLSLGKILQAGVQAQLSGKVLDLAAKTPKDGYDKKMFNGKKCDWCPVKETCYGLEGFVSF